MIAEVEPDSTEYLDTQINGYEYSYYVVAKRLDGEETAACQTAPCAPAYAIDEYDSDTVVRNVIAYDGCEDFETDNARSRRVRVKWSKVHETQLQGYHVYRRCEYGYSNDGLIYQWPSMHTFACEHSWVRLTTRPISGDVRVFEDSTTGGLGGGFTYIVRPVGPDGQEGDIRDAVAVNTYPHNLYNCLNDEHYWYEEQTDRVVGFNSMGEFPTDEFGEPLDNPLCDSFGDCRADIYPIPMWWELHRIGETIELGQESPEGPPTTPRVIQLSEFISIIPWNPFDYGMFDDWGVLRMPISHFIEWEPNRESDLAGYHVEMAGSPAGPWQRLTMNLVAWWETGYTVKGISYLNPYDDLSPGHPECAHYRVIAVDEDGNESEPGYPVYMDLEGWDGVDPETIELVPITNPECGEAPTPPAPRNLRASTEDGQTKLEWDAIPDGNCDPFMDPECDPETYSEQFISENMTYYVYRLPINMSSFYFYVTDILQGTECVDGTCSIVPHNNDYFDNDVPPEIDCPIETTWDVIEDECGEDYLSAYYVTAKALTGGESPRSGVVFWQSGYDLGYDAIEIPETDENNDSGTTPANLWEALGTEPEITESSALLDAPVCDLPEPVDTIASSLLDEPRIASMVILGQVSDDPPYEILDIHVDHLGSTRLVTDEVRAR